MKPKRWAVIGGVCLLRQSAAYNIGAVRTRGVVEKIRERKGGEPVSRQRFVAEAVVRSSLAVTAATWLSPFKTVGVAGVASAGRPAKGEIEAALPGGPNSDGLEWEEDNPFQPRDFARLDESDDALFYDSPKLVEHIDKDAQQAMRREYASILKDIGLKKRKQQSGSGQADAPLDVLDLCSSWVSHLPDSDSSGTRYGRVAGLGMSAAELKLNPQLTEWTVQDLNKQPTLPYEAGSFDVVLLALSIDYLTRPLSVLKDVSRVLRPGGVCAVVYSNRLFLTKAVGVWTGQTDVDHTYLVGNMIHFCGGSFAPPRAKDISPSGKGDPLYVVTAEAM